VRVLLCEMDPTKLRMRYLLGIFLAAVVTAAVLRHVLHTQVGITREDIRTGVLIAAAVAIFLFIAFFGWRRRQ
jgi:fluoride ion exporter CrcB/FEX